jgi:hypothetical protein
VKAARAERDRRAQPRRPPSSLQAWTFGDVLTDWQDRHCDSVHDSTMQDYGPALKDLRRALDGVRALVDRRAPRGL